MAASMGLVKGPLRRHLRGLGLFVGVLVALTWVSGAANAAIIERSKDTNHYDIERWDCGYPMRVVGHDSHSVHIRADNGLEDNIFFTDNYAYEETWTAADGRSFGLEGNGIVKDVRAKRVEGSVYKFTFHESGQPIRVTDSSGDVVYRDRGNLSFTYTVDIADGTFNFLGVKVAGPHPLFDLDLCKAVQPLVGGKSDRYLTARPVGSTDFRLGFYEYLPPSYSNFGAKSPLLLAFNGYGENGDGSPDELGRLLFTGIPRFIYVGGWPTNRPLVVLAMQHHEPPPGFDFSPCDGVQWGGSCAMKLQHDRGNASPAFCTTPDEVHDFINFALNHYNVDPERVYVTGLSCGAFGVWEYLAQYGDEKVAAAVPIAGDGRPAVRTAGCDLGSVPIWAIHGELDDVVSADGSIRPMTRLASCSGIPANERRLTVYPDLFHDGWDQAYSGSLGDDIYTWMLGFSN